MAFKKGEITESERKLFDYIGRGEVNDAKSILKEKDVRVDCLDENGMTPLQQAAYRGNKSLCELLLSSGADVNSNYHDSGYTALMFAALSGSLEVTRLILEAGAVVDHINSVGRNASQMAAFVGQHQVVSLINNFFSKEDLEYYTQAHDLETEPKLPPQLAPSVYKLVLNNNMKTVKVCLFLQEHKNLLEEGEKVYRFFDTLCEKMMKQKFTNEVMAMKFHYYHCAIKKCYEQRDDLDAWIKALLKCDENMFELEQEKFIRSTFMRFPYTENQLIRQMVRQLHSVKIGDTPTALDVLDQTINGQRMPSETEKYCAACGDQGLWKKCTACKYVSYCKKECQKLHWFTHKKSCKKMAEFQKQAEENQRLMEEQEKLDALRLEEEAKSETLQSETKPEQNKTTQNETIESKSQSNETKSVPHGGPRPKEKGTKPQETGSNPQPEFAGDTEEDPAKEVPILLQRARELMAKKAYRKAVDVYQRAMELDASCQEAVLGYRKAFMQDLVDPDDIKRRAKASPVIQEMLKDPELKKKLEEMQKDPEALRKHMQDEKTTKAVEKLLECALIDNMEQTT